MNNKKSYKSEKSSFRNSFHESIRSKDKKEAIARDFKELKEFFFSEEQKENIKNMSWLKRIFYTSWWLLKTLFNKLTPIRRLLVLVGTIFILININQSGNEANNSQNLHIIGGIILLFVLMLELKDKLLAKNELEAGRKIQQALLPERSPNIPGWDIWLFTRSANEVSGDLIDYFPLEKSRHALVIADVAGKGLHAALLMAKLQTIIRTLAPDSSSIGSFGKKLNSVFSRESLPNIFATVIYLEIKPDHGKVKLLNAGHYLPIGLINNKIQELPKGNPALGILHNAKFIEQSIQLKKDDFLLIYSDGLSEARNEEGEFYGKDRILELLPKLSGQPAQEIGNRLIKESDQFVGTAKANDDLSLIVLKHI
ncbi:MAG: hypothetical protein A2V66_11130 [Ignavibacteria bacterium RBG_13_36_8]|nr:MAG: hypothetical protein A2V66_11130 [Ignavibacteria bacterium RBG_13_36_8]